MAAKPTRGQALFRVVTSVLAAATIVLTIAGCSRIAPLGPDQPAPTPAMPPPRHLGSPIILQVMRSRPATTTGGCPAGSIAVAAPFARPVRRSSHGEAVFGGCYLPVGTQVTITSAAVSPVASYRQTPAPGQPAQPTQYGFAVAVPAADVAAVTALIRHAYDSRDAVGVSAAGTLWQAPRVDEPFPGQQFQITFASKNQAVQLYRILIPPS